MKTAAIITNYNQGQFAQTAIQSIEGQSHRPEQCIIVDDCSTDNSIDLIEKAIKNSILKWEFIKRDRNGKPAGCRNSGIQALRKDIEVVAFLDVDDFYHFDKILKSVEVLETFPSVGLVYSDYITYDVINNKRIREFKHKFSQSMLEQACIVSTNSVIRRSVLDKVGFFNTNLYGVEDYEMWLRISMIAEAYHVGEPLFTYRQHGGNLTAHHSAYMQAQIPNMKARLTRDGFYVPAQ